MNFKPKKGEFLRLVELKNYLLKRSGFTNRTKNNAWLEVSSKGVPRLCIWFEQLRGKGRVFLTYEFQKDDWVLIKRLVT